MLPGGDGGMASANSEAIAFTGVGVFETLKDAGRQVLVELEEGLRDLFSHLSHPSLRPQGGDSWPGCDMT